MKYKIEFNYRYGKDYVYCDEYREDEQRVHSQVRCDVQLFKVTNPKQAERISLAIRKSRDGA